MMIGEFVGVAILGYMLGSIPFGVLVGKISAGVDVREYGSGKMGTTNVLRTLGRKAAIIVAFLDLLKGVLAVVFAGLIIKDDYILINGIGQGAVVAQVAAALAAVAGHNWPLFLKFRGGRGVATYFGGLVALCPVAAVFSGEVFFIGAGLTRFASFGSIAGVVAAYAILVPLTIWNGFPVALLGYAFVGAVMIILMHRDNISRLLAGKERKLGDKSPNEKPPQDDHQKKI